MYLRPNYVFVESNCAGRTCQRPEIPVKLGLGKEITEVRVRLCFDLMFNADVKTRL